MQKTGEKTVISIGGVRGRHEMPATEYLINNPVADFSSAHREAYHAMKAIIEASPKDAVIRFYPTGLTAVTLGAIAAFVETAGNDHTSARKLEVWEWDRERADYRLTVVFEHDARMIDDATRAYGYVRVQMA